MRNKKFWKKCGHTLETIYHLDTKLLTLIGSYGFSIDTIAGDLGMYSIVEFNVPLDTLQVISETVLRVT